MYNEGLYKAWWFLGVFVLIILGGHPDCTNVTFQETMSVLAAVFMKLYGFGLLSYEGMGTDERFIHIWFELIVC